MFAFFEGWYLSLRCFTYHLSISSAKFIATVLTPSIYQVRMLAYLIGCCQLKIILFSASFFCYTNSCTRVPFFGSKRKM